MGQTTTTFAASQDQAACQAAPDERLDALLDFMYAQPLHREIYYRVLEFCRARQALPDVEEFIMGLPEFASATQSPFFIIDDLRYQGALACIELDVDGNEVTDADKEGLDENAIDDLVVSFAYEDTDLGMRAAARCTPDARFEKLASGSGEIPTAYLEIMRLLQEKHGAAAVDALLQGLRRDGALAEGFETSKALEDLEKAGVIFWQQGWLLTEEGKEILMRCER